MTGQDSIQPVVYQGQIFWFWGDTNQLQYPLGLFRMAGAVSTLPAQGGLDPADGIDLQYFTDDNGFARAMAEVPNSEGVVWIHGVCVVKDEQGRDRMVGQFSRRKGLTEAIEQSIHKDSPSLLGEVFYSEAETPQGPFLHAVKIATHPGQSFYNPCHHPFFDQNDGQTIYFEGTYCNTFTNSPATPKYNYNQLMYRLNLNDERLVKVFPR